MNAPLAIPADLLQAFKRFQTDFDMVTAAWLAAGDETPEAIAVARAGLRAFMADPSDLDQYGQGREVRLRALFDFWRALASERHVERRGVVPQLSLCVERRIADKRWKVGYL